MGSLVLFTHHKLRWLSAYQFVCKMGPPADTGGPISTCLGDSVGTQMSLKIQRHRKALPQIVQYIISILSASQAHRMEEERRREVGGNQKKGRWAQVAGRATLSTWANWAWELVKCNTLLQVLFVTLNTRHNLRKSIASSRGTWLINVGQRKRNMMAWSNRVGLCVNPTLYKGKLF